MEVRDIDIDEWSDALPASGYELFHAPEALSVLDEYVDAELRLLGGFKGQEPVGLFPAFVNDRPIGTTVTSPPPSMNVPRLGPVVMPTSPKPRKQESVNRAFVRESLDALDATGRGSLVWIVAGRGYDDPRPFDWAGFDLSTQFTYAVDVEERTTDDVMGSFSRSLRRDVRDAQDSDVTVEVEGIDGARAVYDATAERYAEQDRGFPLSWAYVRDLIEALGERARVYVARSADGEFLSGITVLYGPDAAYFWQGGNRTEGTDVHVNSLVHWEILADLIEDEGPDGVHTYDLMGANTRRLCEYKGKFGGDLVPYYVAESSGLAMSVAKSAYGAVTR